MKREPKGPVAIEASLHAARVVDFIRSNCDADKLLDAGKFVALADWINSHAEPTISRGKIFSAGGLVCSIKSVFRREHNANWKSSGKYGLAPDPVLAWISSSCDVGKDCYGLEQDLYDSYKRTTASSMGYSVFKKRLRSLGFGQASTVDPANSIVTGVMVRGNPSAFVAYTANTSGRPRRTGVAKKQSGGRRTFVGGSLLMNAEKWRSEQVAFDTPDVKATGSTNEVRRRDVEGNALTCSYARDDGSIEITLHYRGKDSSDEASGLRTLLEQLKIYVG